MNANLLNILLRRKTRPAPVPVSRGTDFEAALVARLKSDPKLDELIGERLWPLVIPQETDQSLPCLVYAIAGNERSRHLTGPTGLATARVHFEARAPDYADCKRIQEILRQYDGFRGLLASEIRVCFAQIETHADGYAWPDDGSDDGLQRLSVTYYFKYREPIPVVPLI
jgi:hypothetical protein